MSHLKYFGLQQRERCSIAKVYSRSAAAASFVVADFVADQKQLPQQPLSNSTKQSPLAYATLRRLLH